jgi:tetratricopeptide (TPR) repeat protein
MQLYFKNEADSNLLVKDFETMGILFATEDGRMDSAMHYMAIAAERTADSSDMRNYFQTLASWAKQKEDPVAEAKWLGKYYLSDPGASNVTLFNWGLAAFKAEDYLQADTVFARYAEKYPEQGYGYYWRARANAAIDTAMEWGLAIPHYQSLINLLDKPLDSLSASDKKWLSESYMYLASYEVNTNKDYAAAIDWFTKLLEVDPANETASQYIKILEENIKASQAAGTETKSAAAEEQAPERASRE